MKTPKRIQPLIDEGFIDTVICQLMSGKEATVYAVRCGEEIRCAKVYKESNKRNFHQSVFYTEGRKIKNSRRARAIKRGSCYGRSAQEEAWQSTEVDMLYRLKATGIHVPQPYTFFEGVLLMELITTDRGDIAPRLSDLHLTAEQARTYHQILIWQVVRMLCAGIVHGDLSQYNILAGSQGPVIIDLPQAVDAANNSNARHMIKRDIDNLTTYFSRFVPELAQTDYGSEIWSLYQHGKLFEAVSLTGQIRAPHNKKPVNVGKIMQIINEVLKKEVAWRRYKQERWTSPYSQC
ncbi:MAG: PA4780 family RIO1-like protein kinase [Nitrosomonas sp.]|nr:PA4780 family RIO1-like protein kinase [Nitrosomonas sp.]MDP1951969.1 PA4780 family RIO1-like protein kinase [Nitrosomonas sp.]